MTLSDAELVSQALAGSQAACGALVARYATAAVNLFARLVNDLALAEDLAQEAFVRAFGRLASYDPERRFAAWFLQIVRSRIHFSGSGIRVRGDSEKLAWLAGTRLENRPDVPKTNCVRTPLLRRRSLDSRDQPNPHAQVEG